MTAQPLCLLYIPCPDQQTARTLAETLLTERLIACGNILPGMESHYWWQGSLSHTAEWLLLCKTTPEKAPAATARIQTLHPYECPAILSFAADATPQFVQWVSAETTFPKNP